MNCYFGDDSSLASDHSLRHDDVFLLGGFYIQAGRLQTLERRVREIKEAHGGRVDLPVKWNFADLRVLYDRAGATNVYRRIALELGDLRREVLGLLVEFQATVLLAAVKGYTSKNLQSRRKYHGWALANILQRLGFDCGRAVVQDHVNFIVHLDWPGDEIKKSHFDIFHAGYYAGSQPSGERYQCGPLNEKGFIPCLSYGSMDHDPMLQLADMTVGVSADFIKWSYSGRNFQRIKDTFPLVHRRLRTAYGLGEFQTGFVASPYPFRRHLEAKYNDFWTATRPLAQP